MNKKILFLIAFIFYFNVFSGSSREEKFIYIAHRGLSAEYPEHTFLAYEKAIQGGADYLELDLHMTKDNHLVVIHDSDVSRTTNGIGKVKDLTLEQIHSLDAGSWFDSQFKGLKIPELSDVLQKYKTETSFYIETKKPHLYRNMDKELLKTLQKNNFLSPEELADRKIIIQSFSEESLNYLHDENKYIPLVRLLTDEEVETLSIENIEKISTYAHGVGFNKKFLNQKLIDMFHKYNLDVHIFTVKDRSELRMIRNYNVDGAFIDNL